MPEKSPRTARSEKREGVLLGQEVDNGKEMRVELTGLDDPLGCLANRWKKLEVTPRFQVLGLKTNKK